MKQTGASPVDETADLLSLIGQAIEELQHAIEMLDSAQPSGGSAHLQTVIREIDTYLERIDEDPLLKLAPLAPGHISQGLHQVRADLALVIEDLGSPQT